MQVADYVNGRRRIVAHLGSAHTEAELGLLMQQAQELLERPGQGEFDLGVTPEPVKADLLGPADGGDALLARRDFPERPGKRVDWDVVTSARVVATGSDVLFQALVGVFTDLGFAPVTDEVFLTSPDAQTMCKPGDISDTRLGYSDPGPGL